MACNHRWKLASIASQTCSRTSPVCSPVSYKLLQWLAHLDAAVQHITTIYRNMSKCSSRKNILCLSERSCYIIGEHGHFDKRLLLFWHSRRLILTPCTRSSKVMVPIIIIRFIGKNETVLFKWYLLFNSLIIKRFL